MAAISCLLLVGTSLAKPMESRESILMLNNLVGLIINAGLEAMFNSCFIEFKIFAKLL